jgi:hypothetical protein
MTEFLIFAVLFHVVTCIIVLFVPGVIDLKSPIKDPENSSQGEQNQPATSK